MHRYSTVLIGHPFAPIGCGESLRCSYRAFRSVALRPGLLDVYGIHPAEDDAQREFGPALTRDLGDVNIFFLNADEVDGALAHMGATRSRPGYNILYPNWELAKFPRVWHSQLEKFDEVWAPSQFIADSIGDSVSVPVYHMPVACEVDLSSMLSRRYFGIPESAYTFLFFFDFRSYSTRKNPHAVIDAFRQLCADRPAANSALVIKVNGSENDPAALARLMEEIRPFRNQIILIDGTITDSEVKNLIRCCDCFVSLHRSEGFGRGLAEAMYLGKPLISTGYSGNMDFMDAQSALLVPFDLVPVANGEYPHHEGQVWADADVDQASRYMMRLVDDPRWGRELGQRASRMVRSRVGYRTVGMSYRRRLAKIQA
ncbi:glycosyltransferase involved in cell wall biosynthesis [Lysobacter niabensis]|uniref:Glycosyltransferase involved in cell wall biosynthesis n=1 Tax=Agrilutibacter niabensis TaxID=380628 RepID=A0ABU1VTK0_9GAMM|nr:glycosyltransferase [Lysobacter niabensis]MDR7100819.1 glycosyltransferase involved in cell wall biosynthesis [Lysobacter niabensis]